MSDLLESAVAQFVYESRLDAIGWEEAYGRAVARLSEGIRAGLVRRGTAVDRIRAALRRWTDPDEAAWFAEVLPYRGDPVPGSTPTTDVVDQADEEPARQTSTSARVDPQTINPRPVDGPTLWTSWFSGPRDNTARPARVPWSRLATRLTTFQVYPSKDRCPLWSPAAFRDGRRRAANVEVLSCMVLDFDDGTAWDDILPLWSGIAAAVHTSWSHTTDAPKWRLVMPLLEPVPVASWGRAWAWASQRVEQRNDLKCKDPSRIYYAPAVRSDDAPRFAQVLDGRPLVIPRTVLEEPRRQRSAPPVQRRGFGDRRRSEVFKTDEHARRALGEQLGGRFVSGGNLVKGVACPSCGRPSLAWWVTLGTDLRARCNHRNSCGAVYWLDELEA